MGNICSLLSKNIYNFNDDDIKKQNVQIATPLYEYPYIIDCSNQICNEIPVATPINEYPNNYQQNSNNYQSRNNGQTIIINNNQPYYNNGLAPLDGFLAGMLIGDVINNDCEF